LLERSNSFTSALATTTLPPSANKVWRHKNTGNCRTSTPQIQNLFLPYN
jgi:hypothetical protein